MCYFQCDPIYNTMIGEKDAKITSASSTYSLNIFIESMSALFGISLYRFWRILTLESKFLGIRGTAFGILKKSRLSDCCGLPSHHLTSERAIAAGLTRGDFLRSVQIEYWCLGKHFFYSKVESFGPAALTASLTPFSNVRKFFMNKLASFRAVAWYAARSFQLSCGTRISFGTLWHSVITSNPKTGSVCVGAALSNPE